MTLEFQGSEAVLVDKFGIECKNPLLNLAPLCVDQVVKNLIVAITRWEDDTPQPMIIDYNSQVTAVAPAPGDVCEPLTLDSEIQECTAILPNQVLISVQKPEQLYTDALKKFCIANGIFPNRAVSPFDASGQLKASDPISERFLIYQMSEMRRGVMQYLTSIIMGGDSANPFEVDGIMTQLRNGWSTGNQAGGCEFFRANIIDWGEITGAGVGVPAPPDATIDNAFDSITLNGYTFSGLEGLNLTEFFVLYMEAMNEFWFTQGVDQWALWLPQGETNCIAELAACMQPCDDCPPNLLADPLIRERFRDFRMNRTIELYPHDNPIPLWTSPFLKTASPQGNQTMVFAPWIIGGDPTVLLAFRNQDEQVAILQENLPWYGTALGIPSPTNVVPSSDVDVAADLENLIFTSNVGIRKNCFECWINTEFAVPVFAQQGYLVIDNVDCATLTPVCNDEPSTVVDACVDGPGADQLSLEVVGLGTLTAGDTFRVLFTDGSQMNATVVSYTDPDLILTFAVDLDCTFGDGPVSVTPIQIN